MGFTVSFEVTLGLKMAADKLEVEKRERGCRHKDSGDPFCPKCGKSTWTTETHFIPEYNESDKNVDGEESVLGYRVIRSEGGEESVVLAIGTGIVMNRYSDSAFAKVSIPKDFDRLKQVMWDKFGPIGLWDAKSFGIWVIDTSG